MKKLLLLAFLALGGLIANAQTKPVNKTATKTSYCTAKSGLACKSKSTATAKAMKPSCCKNEKAMSALRRPIAKPLSAAKKTK